MPSKFKNWVDQFRGRHAALPSLDLLASWASPTDSLESRLNWLVDVVQWIRRPGHENETLPTTEYSLQAARMRRWLDLLERNPEWKLAVAKTLRSIIRETSALELFSETGLPRQFGLFSEAGERLTRKFLPPPPGSAELGVIFERLFPYPQDAAWIEKLDTTTLERFHALLEFEVGEKEAGWNTLSEELHDALLQLASQLHVNGSSCAIRARIPHQSIRELPFTKLTGVLIKALAAAERHEPENLTAELNYLHLLIDGCYRTAEDVLGHLEKRGVSTDVVYQLTLIESLLDRFEVLLELAFNPAVPVTQSSSFVALLVRNNQARESVVALLRANFHLLTRKMVERNAETGSHYITRTAREYMDALRRACGGGGIMGITTWIKTLILRCHFPGLVEGLAASGNYASGFVAIQLTGSILATKQPATTAPALAARMHQVREPAALEELIDEVVYLIRSQFASILGNLTMIIPTMIVLNFIIPRLHGGPVISAEEAPKVIHSLSILGPSFLYAGFTGILLWASSLVGAGVDNWFVCNQVGESLGSDRRLMRTLGPSRTLRFSRYLQKNMAGFGSNISFGFMLGLIPEVAKFAGFPLDIRHITLSTGMLTSAAWALGAAVFSEALFWQAVIGVLAIGFMNVAVSFTLAMLVAIRARDVRAPERKVIYWALFKRFIRHPFSFILPLGLKRISPPTNPDIPRPLVPAA